MKKIVAILMLVSLLQACTETPTKPVIDKPTSPSENKNPTREIPSISLKSSSTPSIIGWLTNDEIAFVTHDNGEWSVQSYTISTDSWREVYRTVQPIIQAFIHPNKKEILLHTSINSTTAEVQIIHIDGYLIQSLTFESDELYMDWHPTNPDLIAFSAFYEDWTYDTFVYDGSTQALETIEVPNPFVKWYNENQLMVLEAQESSLDGNDLLLYDLSDQTLQDTGISHLVDVQNLGESMLYISINEAQKQYEYGLQKNDTNESVEWTSPAVSNYSEWVIPSYSALDSTNLVLKKAQASGNVDEIDSQENLVLITFEGESELGSTETGPIDCSPDGEVCLGGYEKEKWIQLKPLKEAVWLHIEE